MNPSFSNFKIFPALCPIAGLEPAPGAGLEPAPGAGLEPAPGAGLEPAPGAGLEPAPGAGLEPAPGAGLDFRVLTGEDLGRAGLYGLEAKGRKRPDRI